MEILTFAKLLGAEPSEQHFFSFGTYMELIHGNSAGSMCFMSGSIEMDNVYLPENETGMWQWLFGKNVTSIILQNPGPADGFVGIAAPSLARILPVCLSRQVKLLIVFMY